MAERLNILSAKKFSSIDMGDLSGKTFDEVYQDNPVFTKFSLEKMTSGTGIFKYWLEFIKLKGNERRPSISRCETHQ